MFDLQSFNLLNSDEVTIWNALLKITQTILNVVFNQNMTGQNKVIPQKKNKKSTANKKKKNQTKIRSMFKLPCKDLYRFKRYMLFFKLH